MCGAAQASSSCCVSRGTSERAGDQVLVVVGGCLHGCIYSQFYHLFNAKEHV